MVSLKSSTEQLFVLHFQSSLPRPSLIPSFSPKPFTLPLPFLSFNPWSALWGRFECQKWYVRSDSAKTTEPNLGEVHSIVQLLSKESMYLSRQQWFIQWQKFLAEMVTTPSFHNAKRRWGKMMASEHRDKQRRYSITMRETVEWPCHSS